MTDEEIETILIRAGRATLGESGAESRFFWICGALTVLTVPLVGFYAAAGAAVFVGVAAGLRQKSKVAHTRVARGRSATTLALYRK